MHLTKKAISERIKEIDVVIELLDARLPGLSLIHISEPTRPY